MHIPAINSLALSIHFIIIMIYILDDLVNMFFQVVHAEFVKDHRQVCSKRWRRNAKIRYHCSTFCVSLSITWALIRLYQIILRNTSNFKECGGIQLENRFQVRRLPKSDETAAAQVHFQRVLSLFGLLCFKVDSDEQST